MHYRLTVKAFFFNAKTDYLPYYKHFEIILDEEAKAVDILRQIKIQNEIFSYPEEKLLFKINDLVVNGEESIKEIIERLGTDFLHIDPVNSYRSNNGLIINDDDFLQRYELLAPYASEEDFSYYKTLYALHYASETEKFDHNYIGDAILLLAYRLITQGSKHKESILNKITEVNCGLFECEYENNLFKAEDHSEVLSKLKQMVNPSKDDFFTIIDKITTKFIKTPKEEKTLPKFKNKEIAYYYGGNENRSEVISEQITLLGAKTIHFSRAHKLSGLSLLETAKTLAFKKAGTTLLDALDHGADILVIEDNEVYQMFKDNLSSIERTIGRDIVLELITTEEFLAVKEKIAA